MELIRKDLQRSSTVASRFRDWLNGIGRLWGSCSRYSKSKRSLSPRVLYRIVTTTAGPWLIREQSFLDEKGVPNLGQNTCALGSNQLLVASESSTPTQTAKIAKAGRVAPSVQEDPAVEFDRCLLRIEWADTARPTLEQEIVLR